MYCLSFTTKRTLYNYNYNQIQASEHVILYAYDVTVVCVIASVE